jgi:hypothetical protein
MAGWLAETFTTPKIGTRDQNTKTSVKMIIMAKLLQCILLCAIIGLAFDNYLFAQAPLKIEGIIIETDSKYIDDTEFTTKITAAIQLLKSKTPEEFKLMKSLVGKIRARQASGANFREEIMTVDIAKLTFDASLEWLASVLIHETIHFKKYKDTGKIYGDARYMTDKKTALQVMINEELDCNGVQLIVLEKVGGKKYEIDYLKNQKGDHFDIDKDGDYDEDDYKNRNW